jgi:hypothetical protein
MAAVTAEDLRGPRWDAVIDRILPAPTPSLPGHDTTFSPSLSHAFRCFIPFDLVSLVYSHALSFSDIQRSFPVCWRYAHLSPLTKLVHCLCYSLSGQSSSGLISLLRNKGRFNKIWPACQKHVIQNKK